MFTGLLPTKEEICLAVSKTFEPVIDQTIRIHLSTLKVPVTPTVRGIFMACQRNRNYHFDPDQQENDSVINPLRPYHDD